MRTIGRRRKKVCVIRDYEIIMYPEEQVRQKLLQQLLKHEPNMRHYIQLEVITPAGRADIVIYDEQNNPFLIIELKAPTETLSNHTLEQVMRYEQTLKAPFVATSNGHETFIYEVLAGEPKLLVKQTIEQFIQNQNLQYEAQLDLQRLPYELVTYERYIDFLLVNGYLNRNLNIEQRKACSELHNAIFTETYEPTGRSLPITIVQDLGIHHYAFKNAASGVWEGLHRSFLVDVQQRGIIPFRISILASAELENDPVFNNRKGGTSLNIVMQQNKNSTYNLQLDLNKYCTVADCTCIITHDGRKSRTPNAKVIESVVSFYQPLLSNNRVELIRFNAEQSISVAVFSAFIENLIMYSVARDFT